ncbi:MAG TPA: TonB-dependent receptor [Gemmatimonadales bacterium]|nr:TonB-dependent receptor [Gemmatimonadales bacterium]
MTAGAVEVVVLSETGEVIVGAIVTLTERSSGVSRIAETSEGGRIAFSLVPAGGYTIGAEQIGYRPVHVVGVNVGPGDRLDVRVTLPAQAPPVNTADTVPFTGAGGMGEPDAMHAYGRFGLRRLASGTSSGINGLLDLASVADGALRAEGLPGRLSAIAVDGLPFAIAGHPDLPPVPGFDAAFPLLGLDGAALLTEPLDLEWNDFAGGVLHARSVNGARSPEIEAFGDWSPSSLSRSDYFDPGVQSLSSWRAGLVIRGTAIRDTAHFAIGGGAERGWIAQPRAWEQTSDDALLAANVAARGGNLAPYLAPRYVREERAGGFGTFDWQLAPDHRLRVWTSVARARRGEPAFWGIGALEPSGTRVEANDALAALTLASRFSGALSNELRVGFYRSEREYAGTGGAATFMASGAAFGVDPTLPARFLRTDIVVRDALHLDAGSHRLKLGLAGTLSSHDRTYAYGRSAVFWFADAQALGQTRGFYLRGDVTAPGVRFSLPQFGALLQDRWTVAPGLDVITGIRYDVERIPMDDVAPNQDWFERTGLSNVDSLAAVGRLSSRVGFRWRLGPGGAWLLRGGIGVYYGRVDPAAMEELIGEAGRVTVRRGAGLLGAWPGDPGPAATEVGKRLTLLQADYEPPRSSKADFGVSRKLGREGQVSASVAYRHTDFLLRRADLNRLTGFTGTDQYGRPLYGTLVKEGGLIGAAPGSNRRFSGFELVTALNPDGYSDYWGVTLGLDQPVGRVVRLLASYTYSQTTDNWLGGRYGGPYAELSPFPDSLGGVDWADGRSDLDVPHRLVAGIELSPLGPRGFSVAALYRFRSGLPFTPGFQPGADANGDGSHTNDPAYVDDAVAGVTSLMAAWPCLASQVGRFAERNSCREPDRRALDLRLGLGPVKVGRHPVELWVEALNVVEPEEAVRDQAVYVVDPAAGLVTDPATGRVTVPLVANARFGQPLAYRTWGRTVRLGARVNFQ